VDKRRRMNVFRELQTRMVVTLSEGGSGYSNQSAQRETRCKCELIDRLLANNPERGKFSSKGLNSIDRRISKM
jgi:hypothetical protein